MKIIVFILSISLFIFSVFFSVTNRHLVEISIPLFEESIQLPLFILLLGSLILGIVVGCSTTLKYKRMIRTQSKELKILESELDKGKIS